MATNRKRILNMMLDSEVKLNKLRALATSAAQDEALANDVAGDGDAYKHAPRFIKSGQ